MRHMTELLITFLVTLLFNSYALATNHADVKMTSISQTASPELTLVLEHIGLLREDMNKRYEKVDKRFEFIQNGST